MKDPRFTLQVFLFDVAKVAVGVVVGGGVLVALAFMGLGL